MDKEKKKKILDEYLPPESNTDRKKIFGGIIVIFVVSAVVGGFIFLQKKGNNYDTFKDTDFDGLTDMEENKYKTDSKQPDTDGDGLTDYDEIIIYQSNPLQKDTDQDGYNDYDEVVNGYNPSGEGKLKISATEENKIKAMSGLQNESVIKLASIPEDSEPVFENILFNADFSIVKFNSIIRYYRGKKVYLNSDSFLDKNRVEKIIIKFTENKNSPTKVVPVNQIYAKIYKTINDQDISDKNISNFIFSPGGHKFAYTEWAAYDHSSGYKKGAVVVNGVRGKEYSYSEDPFEIAGIDPYYLRPIFSPDGLEVAYKVKIGNKDAAVRNGKEGKKYDKSWRNALYYENNGKFVHIAKSGDKEFHVIDGEEGDKYDFVSRRLFSPDGKRTAYSARSGDNSFYVVDGKPQRSYSKVENFTFSSDSGHIAFTAAEGNLAIVIKDGKKIANYKSTYSKTSRPPSISNVTFSPDSKSLAYAVERLIPNTKDPGYSKSESFTVSGGFEGKYYYRVRRLKKLHFSPDSLKMAYVVSDNQDNQTIVANDEEIKVYGDVALITFNENNELVYLIKEPDREIFVIGDTEVYNKKLNSENYSKVVLSPDGRHIANRSSVGISLGSKQFITIDGKKSKIFRYATDPVFSKDGATVMYGALDEDWFVKVTVKLK